MAIRKITSLLFVQVHVLLFLRILLTTSKAPFFVDAQTAQLRGNDVTSSSSFSATVTATTVSPDNHRRLQDGDVIQVLMGSSAQYIQQDFSNSLGRSSQGKMEGQSQFQFEKEYKQVSDVTSGPFLGPVVLLGDEAPTTTNSVSREFKLSYHASDRIVGGTDAEPHPFHTMLLLRYGGGYRWAGCGGTLISNCHILTAAHCVADPFKVIEAVFVNAHRPYQDNDGLPFHFSPIESTVGHEGFEVNTNRNDIAILKMTTCISNSTEFPPVQPASTDVPSGTMVDILGFGKQSEQGSIFANVEALQKATVPFISTDTCEQIYGNGRILNDMCCAGYSHGGVDACQGDSGSSMTLVRPEDGQVVQIGVISWGLGCGRQGSPGVYASVPYHFDWIFQHVCTDTDTESAAWCSIRTPPTAETSPAPDLSAQTTSTPSSSPVPSSPASVTESPTSAIQSAMRDIRSGSLVDRDVATARESSSDSFDLGENEVGANAEVRQERQRQRVRAPRKRHHRRGGGNRKQ